MRPSIVKIDCRTWQAAVPSQSIQAATDRIGQMLDQLDQHGLLAIQFTNIDTIVQANFSNFLHLASMCREHHFITIFITHGGLLNNTSLPLEKLVNVVDILLIQMDQSSREEEQLEKATTSLPSKAAIFSSSPCHVIPSLIFDPYELPQVATMIDRVVARGIDGIVIWPGKPDHDRPPPSPSMIKDFIDHIKSLENRHLLLTDQTVLESVLKNPENVHCGGWQSLSLEPTGTISFGCQYLTEVLEKEHDRPTIAIEQLPALLRSTRFIEAVEKAQECTLLDQDCPEAKAGIAPQSALLGPLSLRWLFHQNQ